MCFDIKVVDNTKRLSFQLTPSEVNIVLLKLDFAITIGVKYCRTCYFCYLDDRTRKSKK